MARRGMARLGRAGRGIAGLGSVGQGAALSCIARQGMARFGNSNQGRQMNIAKCKLKSVSAYSQSRPIQPTDDDKKNRSHDEVDEALWRDRMHVTPEGLIFIPPMSFANSLKEAAKYLNVKIPGQRNATWTKHFEAGVMVPKPLVLRTKAVDVQCEKLFVPSDGKRGGGSRVWKRFPLIPDWSGTVEYIILDDKITPDIFDQVVRASGQFIGIGRFRPKNLGYYGRFSVEEITWLEA